MVRQSLPEKRERQRMCKYHCKDPNMKHWPYMPWMYSGCIMSSLLLLGELCSFIDIDFSHFT